MHPAYFNLMINECAYFDKKTVRLLKKDLYLPGYCENPDDDEPIWNIRIFGTDEHPVIYAFSSIANMKVFFHKSELYSLKYMKIRSPGHYEAISNLNYSLVINPGTPSSLTLSSIELLQITQGASKDRQILSF